MLCILNSSPGPNHYHTYRSILRGEPKSSMEFPMVAWLFRGASFWDMKLCYIEYTFKGEHGILLCPFAGYAYRRPPYGDWENAESPKGQCPFISIMSWRRVDLTWLSACISRRRTCRVGVCLLACQGVGRQERHTNRKAWWSYVKSNCYWCFSLAPTLGRSDSHRKDVLRSRDGSALLSRDG